MCGPPFGGAAGHPLWVGVGEETSRFQSFELLLPFGKPLGLEMLFAGGQQEKALESSSRRGARPPFLFQREAPVLWEARPGGPALC